MGSGPLTQLRQPPGRLTAETTGFRSPVSCPSPLPASGRDVPTPSLRVGRWPTQARRAAHRDRVLLDHVDLRVVGVDLRRGRELHRLEGGLRWEEGQVSSQREDRHGTRRAGHSSASAWTATEQVTI